MLITLVMLIIMKSVNYVHLRTASPLQYCQFCAYDIFLLQCKHLLAIFLCKACNNCVDVEVTEEEFVEIQQRR